MPKFAQKMDQPDLKSKLIQLYRHQGKSLEDIAKIFGCSKPTIYKQMKRFGIRLRSRSQARLLAQKKGKIKGIPYYYLNNRFFKKWSKEMAYVLGLILTDGCISKDLHSITLAMNDKELLEKVRSVMDSNFPITPSKYQPKLHIYKISRMAIVKDLLRLGITPKKSLTIKFPNVPEQYLSHFIRGVFDGDGTVMLGRYRSASQQNSSPWLITKFCSGSKDFIVDLEKNLQLLGISPHKIYIGLGGKNPSYKIAYGGKDSKKLFGIMYRDTENGLYLQRKYDVFQSARSYQTHSERYKCSDKAPYLVKLFFAHHDKNQRDFSVAEFSRYIRCSKMQIYRWAALQSRPRTKYLERISEYLKNKGIIETDEK